MKSAPKTGSAQIAGRSDNFHRWRSRKDQLAKKIIGLGGFVVIAALLVVKAEVLGTDVHHIKLDDILAEIESQSESQDRD
jgi:hypothetical protein